MIRSIELLSALEEGRLLVKTFFDDDCEKQYFYKVSGYYEAKGWASALYKAESIIMDILQHPENWNIHQHDMNVQPYPWSIFYKETK